MIGVLILIIIISVASASVSVIFHEYVRDKYSLIISLASICIFLIATTICVVALMFGD